jgi:hypothetical protein
MAKPSKTPPAPPGYEQLVRRLSEVHETVRQRVATAVNTQMLETYWQIGHDIVEFEQGGHAKAEYGAHLLENLSTDLRLQHGRGFSLSNLKRMWQLYLRYPISATLSHQLS